MNRMINWFRAILQIEMRALLGAPFRTSLIALLVGIPVAAIVFANNVLLVTEAIPQEKAVAKLGRADFRIDSFFSRQEVEQELPTAATIEPISFGSESLILFGRSRKVQTCRVAFGGLAKGMIELVDGRPPESPGEVAVTPKLMELGEMSVGDEIRMPVGGVSKIVGVAEFPESLKRVSVFYPSYPEEGWGRQDWLVKLPKDNGLDGFDHESRYFDSVISRKQLLKPVSSDVPIVFLLGALAFAIASLVMAASYIVTVQRRQREIGLLAAVGATRFQLMCSVCLSALLTSLLAGGIGCLVGLGFAAMFQPWLDLLNGRRNGSFEVAWFSHGSAIFLGVVTCCLAASIPAWQAARMPVRQALTSRRPNSTESKKWSFIGVGCLVLGAICVGTAPFLIRSGAGSDIDNLAMLAVLGGSLQSMIGLGLSSPIVLVWMARRANALPLSWRLAVRETGRFHVRNGPIVTAILAGMSMTILLGTIYQSVQKLERKDKQRLAANQILLRGRGAEPLGDRIVDSISGSQMARLEVLGSEERPLTIGSPERATDYRVAIGNKELLIALGFNENWEEILQEIESGLALPLVEWDESHVTLSAGNRPPSSSLRVIPTKLRERVGEVPVVANIAFLVSRATWWEFAFTEANQASEISESQQLVWFRNDVDANILDAIKPMTVDFPGTSFVAPSSRGKAESPLWFLFLAAFVLGLIIIGIATTLAGEEARHDQNTLKMIGASPSVYQHQAAARSGMLALLGSWLSVPAGVIPAYGLLSLIPRLEFGLPWAEIATVALGLPIVAYGLTWVLTWISVQRESSRGRIVNASRSL